MSLELQYHKTEKDDVAFLRTNLDATQTELHKLRKQNRDLEAEL